MRLIVLRLPDDGAVLLLDAIENVRRCRPPAAIRKNRVGQRQFGQRDFAAAQEMSPETDAAASWIAGVAAELESRHRRRRFIPMRTVAPFFRFRERLARGDRPFVAVVRALRSPFAENAGRAADHDRAIIERGIFHDRSGKHSLLERSRKNKRRHRRAGRPFRLQRAIVLVVLEIAAADERENAAGLIIQRDDGALQIFRRGGSDCGLLRAFETSPRIRRRS